MENSFDLPSPARSVGRPRQFTDAAQKQRDYRERKEALRLQRLRSNLFVLLHRLGVASTSEVGFVAYTSPDIGAARLIELVGRQEKNCPVIDSSQYEAYRKWLTPPVPFHIP